MVNPIPESVKRVWDNWNIRGIILFSLFLQTILILFAPFRKFTANRLMIMLIWSAYLLADWAANFAVGLIADSQRDNQASMPEKSDLLAFWAPFLLLHLGGPDTITAFALEDNELWIRHFFGLVFQAIAAVYIFLLSLPRNKLFIPTILTFAAGLIKYFERTCALYLASFDRFRDSMLQEPDPGLNYVKIMEEYASRIEAKIPTKIFMLPEPTRKPIFNDTDILTKDGKLDDLDVVHCACYFFKIFKGLLVDIIFSYRERDESRHFFYDRKSEEAYRIIEVELNLFYETFYTKVEVIRSATGYIMRFLSFGSVVVALSFFHLNVEKHGFDNFDVRVTYILIFGAICLDTIALFMLVFSDRTFAALKKTDHESKSSGRKKSGMATALGWFFALKRPRWHACPHKPDCKVLATHFLLRRWSGSFSGQNLIRYCLKGRPTRVHKVKSYLHLVIEKFIHYADTFISTAGKIVGFLHIRKVITFLGPICRKVINFFVSKFNQVIHCLPNRKVITFLGPICRRVINFFVSKFNQVIHCLPNRKVIPVFPIDKIIYCLRLKSNRFINSLGIIDFVNEILYVSHEPLSQDLWSFIFDELKKKSEYEIDTVTARRISLTRGDWIFEADSESVCNENFKSVRNDLKPYIAENAFDKGLLLWHIATELLYQTDGDSNYNEKEFSQLLSDYMLYLLIMQSGMMSAVAGIGKIRFRDTCAEAKQFFESKTVASDKEIKKACREILWVDTFAKPAAVKGDRSKSLLFEAAMLAKQLNKLDQKSKWKLISKMWVELSSYAASHCDARSHAQHLSKGGELITFIWLLMSHFGLGEQFQINNDQGRATLIVGK
ncbi:hypothetical protein AB3S75_000216 [Citrus x aurantiifolia]